MNEEGNLDLTFVKVIETQNAALVTIDFPCNGYYS